MCQMFSCMHLAQLNTGQLGLPGVGHDLNVEPVWIQGVTGCNSIVAIVDDGEAQCSEFHKGCCMLLR